MKKPFLTFVAGVALTSSLAFAAKLQDGDYHYNDTTVSNVDTVVANDGQYMEIGNDVYFYNPVTDTYDAQPGPGASIGWTHQGYRYLGVNSVTGVCTLYFQAGPA